MTQVRIFPGWDSWDRVEIAAIARRIEMPLIDRYWLDDRSVPFGTLLNYLEKYYNQEIRNDNYELRVSRARLADPADAEFATFKDDIARVLRGEREGLHPLAILTAAEYDEWRSDEAFLTWLWHELFPGEDVPNAAEGESK